MKALTAAIWIYSFAELLRESGRTGRRPLASIVSETLVYDGIRSVSDFGNVSPDSAVGFDAAATAASDGAAKMMESANGHAPYQDLATAAVVMKRATAAIPEVWPDDWPESFGVRMPKIDQEIVSVMRVASETLRATASRSGHPLAWTSGTVVATRILESVGLPGPSLRKTRRKRFASVLEDPDAFLSEFECAVLENCNREYLASGSAPSGTCSPSELARARGVARAYVKEGFSWVSEGDSVVTWKDPDAVFDELERASEKVIARWA